MHAGWENEHPQWQMDRGGSIGQSILPGGQAASENGGSMPLLIVFVSMVEATPVKKLRRIQYGGRELSWNDDQFIKFFLTAKKSVLSLFRQ